MRGTPWSRMKSSARHGARVGVTRHCSVCDTVDVGEHGSNDAERVRDLLKAGPFATGMLRQDTKRVVARDRQAGRDAAVVHHPDRAVDRSSSWPPRTALQYAHAQESSPASVAAWARRPAGGPESGPAQWPVKSGRARRAGPRRLLPLPARCRRGVPGCLGASGLVRRATGQVPGGARGAEPPGCNPSYIMPSIPPMPPGIPAPAPSFSGISATMASVVRMFFAIEAAF